MKKLIIFTDVGDTIIDESSEIRKIPFGVVERADCIPGAKEAMLQLYEEGYTIAMVADGLDQSFRNTMSQNGLSHIFAVRAVSELLDTHKPDEKMFQYALDGLGLTDADKRRIVMIGNNIERDITGANRFGIRSILLDWSPRYRYEPESDEQRPTYTIHTPSELPGLIQRLEEAL